MCLPWQGFLTAACLCVCVAHCRWEDIAEVQTEETREEEGGLPPEEEPDIFELEGERAGPGVSAVCSSMHQLDSR